MRICIIGAGAMGGLMAVHLAEAGEDVTVVDVGPHLDAIQRDGLKLERSDGSVVHTERLRAVEDLTQAGEQDLAILAVKANVLPDVVPGLEAILASHSCVLPLQNGIPWWYFQRHGGEHEGRVVQSVDPDGRIAAAVDPARIIGCVTFPAGEIVAPGVIRHVEGNRFPLGELDGTQSERAGELAAVLNKAGFKSFVVDDIRSEIWLKLWGNLSFNPISALTHATMEDMCRFPLTRQLAADMMREAQEVAERLDISFRMPLEKRIEGAEKVGAHKTSMLQDVEHGRALELDAVVGAVVEFGRLVQVPTPSIDAVHALVKLLDKGIRDARAAVQFLKVA
jgi:2-dehydropantoate 2-reductase